MTTSIENKVNIDELESAMLQSLRCSDREPLKGREEEITKRLIYLMLGELESITNMKDIKNGKTYQIKNGIFINLFFKNVLKYHEPTQIINLTKNYKIVPDSSINRRGGYIDIVIETNNPYQFIPIEIKINAKCQKQQCERYLEYTSSKNKNVKFKNNVLYFLSLNNKQPTLKSIGKNARLIQGDELIPSNKSICNNNFVKVISFEQEVYNWILTSMRSIDSKSFRSIESQLVNLKGDLETNKWVQDITLMMFDNQKLSIEGRFFSNLLNNSYNFLSKYEDKLDEFTYDERRIFELSKYCYNNGYLNHFGMELRRSISRLENREREQIKSKYL